MRVLPIVKAISEQENMTHTLNSLTRNPESILGINRVTVYRIANEPDPRLTPRQRYRSLLRTRATKAGYSALGNLLRFARREVLEHVVHVLLQLLDVFAGMVRERVAGRSAPHQFLAIGIEDVDHQSADLVGVNSSGRFAESYEAAPTPATAKAVVERIQRLLVASGSDGHDGHVAARGNFLPALGLERGVDST
jgi:hypothetical protein